MVSIAGLDLPYGSQLQLTRTNYLVVNAASSPTAQGAANLLSLVQDFYNDTPLKPDYIVVDGNAVTSTDPYVITGHATSGVLVPLIGPSQDALASATGTGIVSGINDTDARIGTSANGRVLGILGAGAVTVNVGVAASVATPATPAVLALGTVSSASLESALMGQLMVAAGTANADGLIGATSYIDFDEVMADINASASLQAIDLSIANLNASFVAKGNAAGTTATTLGDVLDNNDDWCIVTILGLVRVG